MNPEVEMSVIESTKPVEIELPELTRKDFASGQEVRWCPGCGDYSILAQVQKVLPDLGIPREKFVFISGIGCSSRFPYYMNTYGFHTIHGRAPTIATGLKIARPDLSVWVITGDGDGLSIGGNHLIHALRRNPDINIILFNNRIYGLTKGQYSPTSEFGKVTKSSPMGSIEHPINPLNIALSAEATFVARSIDVDIHHLAHTLERAARHRGTSFVEVYQNCNIFNDGSFSDFTDKKVRDDRVLYLEDGNPMLFGKEKDRGICICPRSESGLEPKVVELDGRTAEQANIIGHKEGLDSPTIAYFLTQLTYPEFPVPVGVFRNVDKPTYEQQVADQVESARADGAGTIDELLNEGDTWEIDPDS
jgi:2-oxoglutarate/2-oxoacid ferredoxin oxidoreductase subunit beta